MKKIFIHLATLLAFFVFSLSVINAQNVGINDDASTPDASAMLDVKSTTKGILIPRVDIADLATATPVTSPATGLMVYNTNSTTGPGFFYWDGSEWLSVRGDWRSDIHDTADILRGEWVIDISEQIYDSLSPFRSEVRGYIYDSIGSARSEWRTNISDTASILRGEWRGDIHDSLSLARAEWHTDISDTASILRSEWWADIYDTAGILRSEWRSDIADTMSIARGDWRGDISDSTFWVKYGSELVTENGITAIGINTSSPDNSAALDISSTTDGVLVPRMTTSERNLVSSPANGLLVYDTDMELFYFNAGTSGTPVWVPVNTGWHASKTRIKILPSDFVTGTYWDASKSKVETKKIGYSDWTGTTNLGVLTEDAQSKLIVFVVIPTGYKATHVRIYGNDTGRTFDVYESDINDGDIASKGSANVGSEANITDVPSTSTNFLVIRINFDTSKSDAAYGGYVTIEPI